MFCGNCGKKLIDGSLFCMECGTPVPVGRFPKKPPVQQNTADPAELDRSDAPYGALGEADLFGTNSFSEEAVSAVSGAINAFGAEGFQVPTIEAVDLSTGRVRQKAPKKGDEMRVENFSMSDGAENVEITDNIPVIDGCSMEENAELDVILDPYRFLGGSMDDVSLENEQTMPEQPKAAAAEPVTVEPVTFAGMSDNFAALAAEPDIQPSVYDEPVVKAVEEQEPVAEKEVEEPVAEQAVEEPVAEQAIEEPVAEQEVEEPVAEQEVEEPVAEQEVEEPVAEQAVEEPVAEQEVEEPVAEQAVEEPVAEQEVEEPVAEQAVEEPVAEQEVEEPVAEQEVEEPVAEQAIEEPVAEQAVEEPVAEQAIEEPVAEQGEVYSQGVVYMDAGEQVRRRI